MTTPEYRAAILAVQKAQPQLTAFGFGVYTKVDREAAFQCERLAMMDHRSQAMFEDVCRFLAHIPKTKNINPRGGSSYQLKHDAERWAQSYVYNGIFIAAAIHCGFHVRRCEYNSPNCWLNIASQGRAVRMALEATRATGWWERFPGGQTEGEQDTPTP